MCCWVQPLKALANYTFKALTGSAVLMALWTCVNSYAETWDPLNALLNMGKHKNNIKTPVARKSFKTQEKEGNVSKLLVLSFSLVSMLNNYKYYLGWENTKIQHMHYKTNQPTKKTTDRIKRWESLKQSKSQVQISGNYILKFQLFYKPILQLMSGDQFSSNSDFILVFK